MAAIADYARTMTMLTDEQINSLVKLARVSQFASDLCQEQILVYTRAREPHQMAVVAQLTPNIGFYNCRPNLLGQKQSALEEPLIWRTLTEGKRIDGQREWGLGHMLRMHTYPLKDAAGHVIAAVSFESSQAESPETALRRETAYTHL